MTRISDMTPVQVTSPTGMYAPVEKTGSTTNYRVDLAAMSTITPQMFGSVGDGVTDDSAAFVAAIAYLKSIAGNVVNPWYKGSPTLFIPAGSYYLGTTTLDITHTLIIEGESTGLWTDGAPTQLRWAPGVCGFRFQDINTTGSTGTTAGLGTFAGSGAMLRGLTLIGGLDSDPTEGEFHAILIRTRVFIDNVGILKWQGDGIHAEADVASGGANASLSQISNCRIHHVRHGVYLHGGDANVINVKSVDVNYARRWGFWDAAFLGNRFEGCHTAGCGIFNPGYTPSVVSIGGNLFAAIAGQETGASTNPPTNSTVTITIASPGVVTWAAHGLSAGAMVAFSTTGALPTGLSANTTYFVVNPSTNTFQVSATYGGVAINTSGSQSGTQTSSAAVDNTWWFYVAPGGVSTGLNNPAWVNGITVLAGGGYYVSGGGANTTLDDCYSEGGQGPVQMPNLGLAINGTHATGVRGAFLTSHNGVAITFNTLGVEDPNNSFIRTLIGTGKNTGSSNGEVLANFNPIIGGTNALSLAFPAFTTDVLYWTNWRGSYSDDLVPYHISMNGSSVANAPWGVNRMNFPLGYGFGYKKRYPATVTPATARLVGDVDENTAPTATTPLKWITTAAGTPGTQILHYPYLRSAPTTGIGYVTGAGGAVTQLTDKSTATPAINKVCGQVTMNNAALAGGAKVSFVVTNSTVAATDTVIVSVASGGTANAYRAAVTAISAGVSFTVTVENITGGSLSEAPVINFAILKAVAA